MFSKKMLDRFSFFNRMPALNIQGIDMSLFRKEAVSHQSERLTGAITLAQPLSLKLTVLILVSIAVAIIAFLFSAQYSRKELNGLDTLSFNV